MRVGMLTSGGDCQSLNATMRGVAKTLYNNVKEIEIIGFLEGYKGLMHEEYKIMKPSDFSGILTEGGTIIGTSRQPFKLMRVIGEDGFDKVEAIICSMTPQEKRNTKLLNGSRRMRIAKGSGTTVQDVNKFMKSFEMTQKMMKQLKSNKGGMKKMMKNIENMNPNDLKNFKF